MTLTDPFADAPTEAPEDNTFATPSVAPTKPAAIDHDSKIVLTFKEGTGFDSSWIVVHAGSVAEADALLDQSFADLMAKTKKVASHFRGGAAPSSGGARPAASDNGRPAGATEAPAWAGAAPAGYKYASGVKNGRTWHAWFPIERDGGEKIWLNPPK